VQDFYQGALGRQPSASEFSQWTATLTQAQAQSAGQLQGAAQSLGATLFTSSEYLNLNTNNAAYVTDLYEYLHRAPDQDGYALTSPLALVHMRVKTRALISVKRSCIPALIESHEISNEFRPHDCER
jgi:hypothetical protein